MSCSKMILSQQELLEGQPKKMHMRKEWTLMTVKAKEPKHEPKQIVIDFSLFCGLCRCLDCCYGFCKSALYETIFQKCKMDKLCNCSPSICSEMM